ncbi:MAG: alpha-galactosidase [Lachnospiraceae bacterium]|nr:alpha-galactosidase [Lachnospiraceae bacterium]
MSENKTRTSRISPDKNINKDYLYPTFDNNEILKEKKTGHLPAMGWNSWNAFGSNNTEALTLAMADKLVELGLDKLGYKYVVLDDGCYKSERVNDRLTNETFKFPNDFKTLSKKLHDKGLKFGMYNDIGTNLCAGSAVGTCGFEDWDAKSYIDWDIDFLKVDNCYYLWDNATFSNPENAKYTYAPNIKAVKVVGNGFCKELDACKDGTLLGRGAYIHKNGYVTNIGTFDGTNVGPTPIGDQSGELSFNFNIAEAGEYEIYVTYATGRETEVGEWLQVAVGNKENEVRYFDDLLPATADKETFEQSKAIVVKLNKGDNIIRLMNHRRQENVINSYAAMFYGLYEAAPEKDILLSICEWGKTQPHNWGYKLGNSWRILNDITFNVGSDGDPGKARWTDPGTASITSQYNKAVVMDEFAGLEKGWNDPDMLVIGMDGVTDTMSKTHMTMWCMMNSPLMLGMDLRKVNKGDNIYNIIANKELIALNQDKLGIQAKRVYCSIAESDPDKIYITNNDRIDILAKPLADGDFALSFINLSDNRFTENCEISKDTILSFIGNKMTNAGEIKNASKFVLKDLWTGKEAIVEDGVFSVKKLEPYDNLTVRVSIKR